MQIQSSADKQAWLEFIKVAQQARARNSALSKESVNMVNQRQSVHKNSESKPEIAHNIQKLYTQKEPQAQVIVKGQRFDAYA